MAMTDPIAAIYVDSARMTATVDAAGEKDLREQCAVGVQIKADCGVDGYKYGSVVSVSYSDPATTIEIDGDDLTANLVSFWHSNDSPDALPNHVEQHYIGGRDAFLRATTSFSGVVKLSTVAGTLAGTDTTTAVTPAGVAAVVAALPSGSSKWTALASATDYTATPASTSTLTMLTDQTADIKPGMALRYTIGGTAYYGICTAITSSLLTVAGAPLSGDVTALAYSIFPGMVETIQIFIANYWADTADASLIVNDLVQPFIWDKPPAVLVKIKAYTRTTDTGASFPRVNARIGATTTDRICTSNSAAGLALLASATWYQTTVDIDPAKYAVVAGQAVEITTDANGGNDNAADLSVMLIFVHS